MRDPENSEQGPHFIFAYGACFQQRLRVRQFGLKRIYVSIVD